MVGLEIVDRSAGLAPRLQASGSSGQFGPSVVVAAQFSRQIREFLQQRRSGKRRITAAFLQQVAEVYRANINHAPTEAVSRTFGVKHRMATDYVKQARDRGLLPPTKQGRTKA